MDTRLRLTLAASLCLAPIAPLAARLAHLQILEHADLDSRASGKFSRSRQETPPRADILDRNGHLLAQSVTVWSCFLDKRLMKETPATSRGLSGVRPDYGKELAAARILSGPLGIPEAEVLSRLREPGRLAWMKTGLRYEEAAALAALRVAGLGLIPVQERFYPNGDLARGVLGQVSAEGRGISGLELTLEERLRGKPRKVRVIRDGAGKTIHRGAEGLAPAPQSLRLTLDRNIQYYAEEILRETAEIFSIKQGLVAVQDPANGEILAMAGVPADPLRNPFVQDTYEPGSTFKVVAAAAAIEESLVREDESFFCENGTYEIAPRVIIRDHEPQGALTLAGILEHSSNIGMVKLVGRLGPLRFYHYSRAFGFGGKTGIPLPGETAGELKPLSDLSPIALAAASYGYGVGASPLQVLGAYSAIANGGTLWEPDILHGGPGPVRVRRIASPKSLRALALILEGVVERGTGAAARIPGYRVAGKTGTARQIDPLTKKYSTSHYNASFVGFLPASDPQWTILVVIEDPKGQYYGSQVAAPVFAKLGRRLLALRGVPPDRHGELALAPHLGAEPPSEFPLRELR